MSNKDYLQNITPEEREVIRLKGVEAKEQKKAWAKDNLRNSYADNNHWRELASEMGILLPLYYIPCTETKQLKRVFRKTGMNVNEWLTDSCGMTTLKQFSECNPDMPAYAMVGLALEWIVEQKGSV